MATRAITASIALMGGRTLTARDWKDAPKVLVRRKMNDIKVLGTAYPKPQNYKGLAFASGRAAVYDVGGIAPTLVTATGGATNLV